MEKNDNDCIYMIIVTHHDPKIMHALGMLMIWGAATVVILRSQVSDVDVAGTTTGFHQNIILL